MQVFPIIISYLTLMCFGFIDNGRGPAYPFILEHFNVSSSLGSFLFTLSSISALFANYTSKWWLSSLGSKKSLQLSLLFQLLGTLGYAYSAQTKGTFSFILLSSLIFGLGAGSSNVCISIVISKSTKSNQRRKVFSGLHSIYAVSSLLSPLIFSITSDYFKNWYYFFYLLAILPLGSLFVSLFKSFSIDTVNNLHQMKNISTSLKMRFMTGLMLSLNVTAEVLISSRLVFYLQEAKNFKSDESNLRLSLFFLSLLIGRLIPAFITLPFRSINILIFSATSSLILTLVGLNYNTIFLSFVGATMAIFFPTTMDWISKFFKEKSDYMMASSLNYVGLTLILMHFSFGILAKHLGIEKAMNLSPMALLISLVFLLYFRKKQTSN